ncbi:alpha/beta fold hydrolase [soil metagenome]
MKYKFITLFIFCFSFLSVLMAQKPTYDNNKTAGHFAMIHGIKLYYEVYGKGTPLLMLHGNGGNISAFEKQIPFFSRFFQVIAVDSRLQGKSGGDPDSLSYDLMAKDFCALVDYLKLDSVYVLGWSDGGINAILMAMQCSGKVKRIAFTGANVVPDSTAVSGADIASMKDFVENDKKASRTEKTLTRMMILEPNIPYAALAKIKCPVLVMAGDHDIIKATHTLQIFQSIPGAQLCIFPNSNHGVCQQHPELFNNIVLNFLQGKN